MNISIFDPFSWKMPIYVPEIGVFGQFDPQNGVQYQGTPLGESASFEPLSVKMW